MSNLYLTSTLKTPEINFNNNGDFYIKGNSYPENVIEFYTPIKNWLCEFFKTNESAVELHFDLYYINTSSIKSILNILLEIKKHSKRVIKIEWQYESDDDDMLDVGEDLERLTNIKFCYKEK